MNVDPSLWGSYAGTFADWEGEGVKEPYYATPDGKVTLYAGHVIDVLREMPAESVNCVCTSPPYWSLRKYDCEPVIWGGDPNCPHTLATEPMGGESYVGSKRWQHDGVSRQETPEAWVKAALTRIENHDGLGGSTLTSGSSPERRQAWQDGKAGEVQHAICSLCGAWRGQYGLEPTPDCGRAAAPDRCGQCYVCHTVGWLREVKRVIRKDGVVFLNCGDGYFAGSAKPYGTSGKGQRDSAENDCPSLGRDGECPAAPSLRSSDNDCEPLPATLAGSPVPNQERRESPSFHVDTWDCEPLRQIRQSCAATQGQRQSAVPVAGHPHVAPASNLPESSQQLRDGDSQDDSFSSFLSMLGSSLRGCQVCAHRMACPVGQGSTSSATQDQRTNIGDTIATAGASDRHTQDKVCDSSSYLHSTTTSHPIQLKPKDAVLMPFRVALAAQADGWWVRSVIIWHKPNPMPESVRDRPTDAHEYIFLLTRSKNYWYDADAVREGLAESTLADSRNNTGRHTQDSEKYQHDVAGAPDEPSWYRGKTFVNPVAGRNMRSVWTFPTQGYPDAHFAVFPRELPERCIKAGAPVDGVVLDPFAGSGTTCEVAYHLGRTAIGIDASAKYLDMAIERVKQGVLAL